jgi:hypothetical protein
LLPSIRLAAMRRPVASCDGPHWPLLPDRSTNRGGCPGLVGYQDAIDHRGTTIDPGGCAPARSEHSVDLISQTSVGVAPVI